MKGKLTADEFYHRRDDRTNRLTDSRDYHNLHIRLTADDFTIHSYVGQVQLIIAANMLARWCRWIEFGFSDVTLYDKLQVNGIKRLHDRIFSEISQADPFGVFTFKKARSNDVQYTLQVGKTTGSELISFTVDTDGWTVYGGTSYKSPGTYLCKEIPVGRSICCMCGGC